MTNRSEERIKLFAMANALAERDLDLTEASLDLELGREAHAQEQELDSAYYPQFDHALRKEAARMGAHYELFYCLETSIRQLVAATLEAAEGEQWWANVVPEAVQTNVALNIQREMDSGVTLRSDAEIDYTTFGELGEIVKKNWAAFDTLFSSAKAFTKIMTSLNQLRGPIAHCCPLAEDEVVRLRLTIGDWFRLME